MLNQAVKLENNSNELVAKTISNSFNSAVEKNTPYQYWLFENALPLEYCEEIISLPINPPQEYDNNGKRDSRNDLRRFFSPEMRADYSVMDKVALAFQNKQVTGSIEKLCNVNLKDTYLRIEYCQDRNGFWLEPHMDIKEKRITIQIYLNKGEGAEDLGTDIYNPDKSHFGRAPANMNQGMIFVPKEPNSFHGFEKRIIKNIRRSLIINYVTDDWRAMHELSFPDNKI
jgi:hypothetical protein